MTTIDFSLWLAIEGLGVAVLVGLIYKGIWQVMPWFTAMTLINIVTDPVLAYLWISYPHHFYYWPGVANTALTMFMQVGAMMQLLFLRKASMNSAARMGMALLGVFLLECLKLMRVAWIGFSTWYPTNHIVQTFYIAAEILWVYWLWKINKEVGQVDKERIRYG